MRIIAVANQKGGTGKTTTTVNLAATLAERGRTVLIIDLDAQDSSTDWFRLTLPEDEEGFAAIFTRPKKTSLLPFVVATHIERISLIQSSETLAEVESSHKNVGAELTLREKLREIPKDRFDYVLIDCPPALGFLSVNALTAADEVLIPVEVHYAALKGLSKLWRTIGLVQERLNPALRVAGILPFRTNNAITHRRESAERLRTTFPDFTLQTEIRENAPIPRANEAGIPITAYDPKSYGSEDYRSLADELIAQEVGRHGKAANA